MSLTTRAGFYHATVPMMIKGLHNLQTILDKTERHCQDGKIDEKVMLYHRLIPDMRPIIFQVQNVSDSCKSLIARIHNKAPISMEDNEQTFDDLRARIQKTIKILEGIKPEDMDISPTDQVKWDSKRGTFYFTVEDYVYKYSIPNFHFHLCTAYCIARSVGVPVGAMDYLDADRTVFRREPIL